MSLSGSKPRSVGLTGNIGSGKSAVARLLQARGAAVIDADALARDATRDPAVLARIAAAFGPDLVVDGALDRAALAARVFRDPAARSVLNGLVHPWVQRERERRVAALLAQPEPPRVIVHDIPLLFEVGLEGAFDTVVVVDAPLELRVRRVAARSGLSEEEVRARDAAQLPLAEKVRRADVVIDNSGDRGALERQVEALWQVLVAP
ncbi:dephospho-CoA kinase [Truepera radiovictrix]|uniref:Dephospho-CoA kinase n=1 Tax=Truepera radiovictrix (strain DSM 17093 / CIP 108686 / LMG 22925 / RQ-24) TaxID=649638 RepID=D7CTX1_TRURR|nr:dephospho-CoA kinase [Truepera radiovictrix]ADI15668.1 dephospho-CoA kinase [Truepera radiovictrix DSM 17093]WMT58704.1 dephospho-CoA kinase [Truepera radiovictrix]